MADVLDEAEGYRWVETVEGYRFPAEQFLQDQRFKNVWLKPVPLWTHDKYLRTPLARTFDLWKMEENEGHTLLRSEESTGLDDVSWVERDRTIAEIKRNTPESESAEDHRTIALVRYFGMKY